MPLLTTRHLFEAALKMEQLEELQSLLLLGTDRSAMGEALSTYLQKQGIQNAETPEKTAATALVFFRQWQRAGFLPEKWKTELAAQKDASGSEMECSAQSARCLQEILEGKYSEALSEWIHLLLQARQVLPREALPALFQRCLNEEGLWENIQPAIGNRGQWLLQQNPLWQVLAEMPADVAAWGTSTGSQRQLLLRSIRKQDPALGLPLLQSTWDNEDPAQKAALLAELSKGLSQADEVFLEKCLQERRKETRQMAAELLACIPGSALVKRYLSYLQTCILVENGKIVLQLPTEAPETWRNDGVEISGKAPYSATQRSAWLFQLVRRLPPVYWQQHWGLEPPQTITLFAQQDREESWIQALIDASLLHQDLPWQEALAQWWLEQPASQSWQTAQGRHLLQELPASVVQRLLPPFLQKQSHLLEDDQVATYILSANTHAWEETLSMAVVQPFKRYLQAGDNPFWNIWHYARLLKAVAYRCPPALFPQLNNGWNVDSPLWGRWQAEVERMLAIVQFRARMHKSFIGELKYEG